MGAQFFTPPSGAWFLAVATYASAAARSFLPNPRASLFEDSSPVRSGAAFAGEHTIEKGLDADRKHDMQHLRLKHAASRVKFTDGPSEQHLAATIEAGQPPRYRHPLCRRGYHRAREAARFRWHDSLPGWARAVFWRRAKQLGERTGARGSELTLFAGSDTLQIGYEGSSK